MKKSQYCQSFVGNQSGGIKSCKLTAFWQSIFAESAFAVYIRTTYYIDTAAESAAATVTKSATYTQTVYCILAASKGWINMCLDHLYRPTMLITSATLTGVLYRE